MSEKQKIKIKLPPRRQPQAGGTTAANNWSPGSKPTGSGKPPPSKAPPAAQPAVFSDEDVAALAELTYHGEPPGEAHPKWTLWDTDTLKPHPKQSQHFADQPAAQFKDFVANILEVGMKDAIEILPDGVVVSGHQRLRAARRLGWTHVPVVIRRDLAKATPETVELALIDANRHRRQLSLFEEAKLFAEARRLKEQAGESFSRCELRDAYAKRFQISGRTLDRLLELVDLPIELQQAVADKRLARQAAINLHKLDPEVYEPILQLIREGKSVKKPANKILLAYEWRGELTDIKLARKLRTWLMEGTVLETNLDRLRKIVIRGQADRLEIAGGVAQGLLDVLAAKDGAQVRDEVAGLETAEEESQDEETPKDREDAVEESPKDKYSEDAEGDYI